jgi:uncharacterized Zn finger protein
MSAAFPIVWCAKCGGRMQVVFVQAAKDSNDVTYECLPCGSMKIVSIPKPESILPKSPPH